MSEDKEIKNIEIAIQEEIDPPEPSMPYILGDTIDEAEEVYQKYEKYLNRLSGSYSEVYGLEKSDLFIEALFGLSRAVAEYDSSRSDDFRTFAITKMKDALDTYVRRMRSVVSIPAYISKTHSLLKRIKDETLSSKERAKAVELFQKAAKRANITTSELLKRAEVLPTKTDYDLLADYNIVEANAETKKTTASLIVDKLFKRLTDREKRVAEELMEGWTPADIARNLNITPSAVSQTIKKMKGRLEKLGVELEDIL